MKISSRVLKILKYLKENRETTIKEISKELNLSERAIRYDIESINFLEKIFKKSLIKKEKKGKIIFQYSESIDKLVKNIQDIQLFSNNERYEFVYFLILLNDNINITKLAKDLDISRVTLTKDLKEVYLELDKKKIKSFNKELFNSDENKIRNELVRRFYKKIIQFYREEQKDLISQFLKDRITTSQSESIIKFINLFFKEGYNKFYDIVYSYILIICLRIQNKNFISQQEDKFLKFTTEYKLIEKNIDILEKSFKINFSEKEILNLTDILLGVFSNNYNKYIYQNMLNLKILLKQLVESIEKKINLKLSEDELLLERLYTHIKSCIYRLRNNLDISPEIYMEEMENYSDILEIVRIEIGKLEKKLKLKFSEVEISLITMHILSSVEKYKENKNKKIILVCNSGYGTSILLKNKLEQEYSVEIVDCISYLQLEKYNLDDIDIIVSSIKLENNYSKPIIELKTFLQKDTERFFNSYEIYKKKNLLVSSQKINNLLEIIKRNTEIKSINRLTEEIYDLFNLPKPNLKLRTLFDLIGENNITYMVDDISWKEALELIGKNLLRTGKIKRGYLEEIYSAINKFGAYFVIRNNIAIPHGQIDKNVIEDGIEILYSNNDIIFPENKKVKLIILVASNKKNILINTIKRIDEISKKCELYEILKSYSKNDFINYLKGEEKC